MSSPKFSCGSKVFAKIRGYPPWPATVDAVTDENPKKRKYNVYFYGTKQVATCNEVDLCSYVDNRNTLGKFKKLNKSFNDSIIELDSELGFEPFSLKSDETNIMHTSSTKCGGQKTGLGLGLLHKKHEIVDSIKPAYRSQSSSKPRNRSKDRRKSNNSSKSDSQQLSNPSDLIRRSLSDLDQKYNSPSSKFPINGSMGPDNLVLDDGICQPECEKENYEKLGLLSETGGLNKELNSQNECNVEDFPEYSTQCRVTNNSGQVESDLGLTEEKRSFFKTEARLLTIELGIKSSLTIKHADPDASLKLLDDFEELDIKPLMLKKHPEIVDMLNQLQIYTGNSKEWKMSQEDKKKFDCKAIQIKKKSQIIYHKIQSLFTIPYKKTFLGFFHEEVKTFKDITKNLTLEEYLRLTEDPTRPM